jgi:hypothetical protein
MGKEAGTTPSRMPTIGSGCRNYPCMPRMRWILEAAKSKRWRAFVGIFCAGNPT